MKLDSRAYRGRLSLLVLALFIPLALAFTAIPAKADGKKLGEATWGCYKGNKLLDSGIKFCHNCKTKKQGDQVIWKFEVLDGKKLVGHIEVPYTCGKKYPDETKQKSEIRKRATAQLKKLK